MNRKLRIVYMGTPEFAVEPLKAIIKAGYEVVAVITAPDKPAGRGQKLTLSAVKEFAIQKSLTVLQPANLKDSGFIDELRSFNANLQVVVAFRMLPEVVWQMPEYGTLNLHASLLPQYRGAAPINRVIINGETETGLTTFFIEKEIDTGNIILSEKHPILCSDDAGTLHDRLMLAGGKLVVETIKMIEKGSVTLVSQKHTIAKNAILRTASKIFKSDCKIDWASSCVTINNLVRGLAPFPGAFSTLFFADGTSKQVKIYKTTYRVALTHNRPGSIISDKKRIFSVATNDGYITIEELKLEGKRRMAISEFLRGVNVTDNFHFE